MGLERISGFALLVGHGRGWGAWCRQGKPNLGGIGRGPFGKKIVLAFGNNRKT